MTPSLLTAALAIAGTYAAALVALLVERRHFGDPLRPNYSGPWRDRAPGDLPSADELLATTYSDYVKPEGER